jgi:hypothetical protein
VFRHSRIKRCATADLNEHGTGKSGYSYGAVLPLKKRTPISLINIQALNSFAFNFLNPSKTRHLSPHCPRLPKSKVKVRRTLSNFFQFSKDFT